MRKPFEDNGHELDALFSVEPRTGGFDLIVESRGGSSHGPRASRNSEYAEGLRLHLERMKARDMVLEDLQVVSTGSRGTEGLPEPDRRIEPDGFPLPLAPGRISDVEALRLAIGRASAAHRRVASTGGNSTKRLKLSVRWPDSSGMTADALEKLLAGIPAVPIHKELPTANPYKLEKRAVRARKRIRTAVASGAHVTPPEGQKAPGKLEGSSSGFLRDPNVVAWVLNRADGHCEVCTRSAPFLKPGGEPFLEVHHVRPLAESGPDTPDNAIACCPNCHRELHHGEEGAELRSAVIARHDFLKDFPAV